MAEKCINGQTMPCERCKFFKNSLGARCCHFGLDGDGYPENGYIQGETYHCDLCGAPIDEYTYFHNNELCHECSRSH